jgi:hypothetical protein
MYTSASFTNDLNNSGVGVEFLLNNEHPLQRKTLNELHISEDV